MLEVSETDFVKHFGQYRERVQREAIAVTSHGRTSGFFVSEEEYKEYLQLKANARKAYSISDLPKDTIKSLATSVMNSSHDHLKEFMDIRATNDF
ncbi:type II toxin-antitoxin system Phd/YefM family antitoxin [Methylomonas sp. EFPC1]|uniref:type II toxin-antitoxin system Phd/YefM family antitoxin n=1 Tax=Methylomonas sp. EFPC1 TaxID=2812647 RepID=UPI0019679426|nr:type II toxin-antitoxin system Phd/YefM family antitoxin [Methylomonas sp. EFPC1]QSB02013.1 type II toxin-antitoxin system Phd/YefM family antitoxin [Methylomonas sp. EFPC1]